MTHFLEPRIFFGPPKTKTPDPACKHNKGAIFRGSNWVCKLCGCVIRDKRKQPKDKQ